LSEQKLSGIETTDQPVEIYKVLSDITGTVSLLIFLGPTMLTKTLWGQPIKDAFETFQNHMNTTLLTPLFLIFGSRFFHWNIRKRDVELKKEFSELKDFIKSTVH
jgi:hypothetical protein